MGYITIVTLLVISFYPFYSHVRLYTIIPMYGEINGKNNGINWQCITVLNKMQAMNMGPTALTIFLLQVHLRGVGTECI